MLSKRNTYLLNLGGPYVVHLPSEMHLLTTEEGKWPSVPRVEIYGQIFQHQAFLMSQLSHN